MAGPSLWYLVKGAGSTERFHRKNHGDQIHRRWVHLSITSIKHLPEVINITHPNPGATPSMGKWTPHITSHFRFDLWPKSHAPLTDGCDGCGCEASKDRHQGGGIPIESETPYFRLAGWWFGTWLLFSIIYGMSSYVILPIDELIFFRGVGQPPISDCLLFSHVHTSMHKKETHTASNDSMIFNNFPI